MARPALRYFSVLLAVLCMTSDIPCRAAMPQISAAAYVLMEADSGRVLLARNEEAELSIASTTKIMTALVALEHASLHDTVTVRQSHLKEGSSMYLKAGEVVTVEELLYGLMLPSGNDAAECLADGCGGSVETFVAWMNEKAAALGLRHTSFANPSGLDAQGHYSSALDMARLAKYAMQHPTFLRLVSTASAAAGGRSMTNHNKLLLQLDGCLGLKTGYTGGAGRTLVSCCERDGLRLIAVTLNDGSDWADHTALYDYGFSTFRSERVTAYGEAYAVLPVYGGTVSEIAVLAGEQLYYPLAAEETVTTQLSLPEGVSAPLSAGQKLGELSVFCGETEVGRIALLCAEDVAAAEIEEKQGLWAKIWDALRSPTAR